MSKCPCYQCPDRYPGCSSHCTKPAYLAEQERQAIIRKNRKEADIQRAKTHGHNYISLSVFYSGRNLFMNETLV